ncbi:MAG: FumA C-terminus/TtdB family hydratase beta subunit [Acidilobaceae archaeon]|nr:FumA C-terminus/TtdB family hydratase beta subunit [Acidilobaceae archaeon]MDW7974297.1 FumA C-terminus/TtdB family hydratase beta subunit [Sulfolobales archaeon]
MEYRLKTPLGEEVRELNAGDIVYLTGTVVTMRDAGHRRAAELFARGEGLPVDLRGLALYHAGPVVRKTAEGWEVVVIGPTTSTRMEIYEAEVIERTGLRMIIGKGGMGARTAEACKRHGAVYAVYPGGAAALQAEQIVRVHGVHWLDLGVPDAMWVLEVKELGPLTVVIDSKGRNLYEEMYREARRRIEEIIYPKLGIK